MEIGEGRSQGKKRISTLEVQMGGAGEQDPPMLILHGQNDQRTPVTQAKGFVRAMRQAKLPCEFVTYPREGHYFTERKHIEDLMMRVLRFVGDSLS